MERQMIADANDVKNMSVYTDDDGNLYEVAKRKMNGTWMWTIYNGDALGIYPKHVMPSDKPFRVSGLENVGSL